MSTAVAVGSQFGPYGALVGAIAGTVMAIDGYTSAVAQKEVEMASAKIDKAVEQNEKALDKLSKNVNDSAARQQSTQSIQKIREQETKKAAATERAAQPGMISSALSFVSGGRLGGDKRTSEDKMETRLSGQQAGAQASQARINQELELGKSLREVDAELRATGDSLRNLYSDIAEADSAYQDQVQEIQDSNMAEQLKTKKIKEAKDKAMQGIAVATRAQAADIARAEAAKKIATAMNVQTASLKRTFSNLNQAIGAASNNLQKASKELQNIVSGATGFTADLDALSVLENPAAFSRSQQNAAIQQSSQLAGPDAAFMQQLARLSLDADQIVASGAARAQKSGDGKAKANIAKDTVNRLTKRLEDALGSNQLSNGIRNQLIAEIDAAVKNGDDIDLQQMIDESGLSQSLDAFKQVLEASANSAKFLEDAMNFAAQGADQYGKETQRLRDNQARYQNTILQSNIALKKALGERVDVRENIQARTKVAATKAGVSTDQFSASGLSQNREGLQKEADRIKKSLNNLAQSSDNASRNSQRAFLGLTKKLGETESKLKAVDGAIENLPATIEANINDVIGEIGRVVQEQKTIQQSGAAFAEQLVGSTPEELANLATSFNILDSTLAGQSNTIQQSRAAQQAYIQALQSGSSQQEAYGAAQQAFASQTQSALSLFNQLSEMSGMQGPELNQIRADLLEGFARSQGMGVENSPIFRQILDNLRTDTGETPEVVQLKLIYQELQKQSAEAATAVGGGILSKQEEILRFTSRNFIEQLKQVKLSFNEAQLKLISAGVGRPGRTTGARPLRRSQGGVVYASEGAYVDYQPRGTDTIPAMLTPGEFVVNAKASKQNAGLLTAINNSAGTGKTFSSGGVVYAKGGLGGGLQYSPSPEDIRAMRQWPSFLEYDSVNGVLKGKPYAMAKEPGRVAEFMKSMAKMVKFPKIRFPAGSGKILARAGLAGAGPIFGGIDGYMADPRKTGMSRTYNTLAGIATGGGTTMGDVGAQSTIGAGLGIKPGSALDTQIGNWSQLGLTTAQYSALGVPYPYNLLAAGVALNANEMARLSSDMQNSSRLSKITANLENSFKRSGSNSSEIEKRAIELSGGVIQHDKMSSAEVAWITETGKLQSEIMELKRKDPQTTTDVERIKQLRTQVQDRYDLMERSRDRNGQGALFFRPNRPGYFIDNKARTPIEDIEHAVDKETFYQQRLTRNRPVAMAEAKEKQREEDRQAEVDFQEMMALQKDSREKAETKKRLGLKPSATDSEIERRKKVVAQKQKEQNEIKDLYAHKDNVINPNTKKPYNAGGSMELLSNVENTLGTTKALSSSDQKLYALGKSIQADIDSIENEKYDPNGFYLNGIDSELSWAKDRDRRLKAAYAHRDEKAIRPLTKSFHEQGFNDPITLASYKHAYTTDRSDRNARLKSQEKARERRTARDKEKGRDPRTYNRYNSVANNYGNLNPRQQQMARGNVTRDMQKYGVYDPRLSQEENIDNMNAAGAGHLAGIIYPGAQTQRAPLRVRNLNAPVRQPQQKQQKRTPQQSRKGFFQSIYASQGMLVPYEPRGTDTVPAMLTPGEFVINKAATQKHRPLLESINRSKGGSVTYLQDGGNVATGVVDGVAVERENPLIKKIDENIAKTTQAGNIAAAGRNFSQQGLQSIDTNTQLYNTDRSQGTPNDQSSASAIANHVTNEHEKTRTLATSLRLMNDQDLVRFAAGGPGSGPGKVGVRQRQMANRQEDANQEVFKRIFKKDGGIVYASKGQYVNYEPKGTDTVPAMLTPGEFVVNAKASKQNLGLLHAINSGAMSSGGVVYAQQGTQPTPEERKQAVADNQMVMTGLRSIKNPQLRAMAMQYVREVDAGLGGMPIPQHLLDAMTPSGHLQYDMSRVMDIYNAFATLKMQLANLNTIEPIFGRREAAFGSLNSNFDSAMEKTSAFKKGRGNYSKIHSMTGGSEYSAQFAKIKEQIETTLTDKRQEFEDAYPNSKLAKDVKNYRQGGVVYAQDGKEITDKDRFFTQLADKQSLPTTHSMSSMESTLGQKPNLPAQRKVPVPTADSVLGAVSTGLGVAGMFPVLGEPFDLAAAGIDALRGDYTSAGLGLASTLPFAGMTTGAANIGRKATSLLGDTAPDLIAAATKKRDEALTTINSLVDKTEIPGKGRRAFKDLEIKNRRPSFMGGGKLSGQEMDLKKAEMIAESATPPKTLDEFLDKSEKGVTASFENFGTRAQTKSYLEELGTSPDRLFIDGQNLDIARQGGLGNLYMSGRSMTGQGPLRPGEFDKQMLPRFDKFTTDNTENVLKIKQAQENLTSANKELQALKALSTGIEPKAIKEAIPPVPKGPPPLPPPPDIISPGDIFRHSIQGKSRGGMVYASNGMLIPYRPQGTDTVPAMLTPGEFVVNKEAAKQNLTSLQAMNQGGRVSYLSNGTPGVGKLAELDRAILPVIQAFQHLTQNIGQNAPPNTVAGGVSSNSLDTSGLGTFADTFGSLVSQLTNITLPQIPSLINLQMAPATVQVDITGAEALGALAPDLQKLAETIVSREIVKFQQNNIEN